MKRIILDPTIEDAAQCFEDGRVVLNSACPDLATRALLSDKVQSWLTDDTPKDDTPKRKKKSA